MTSAHKKDHYIGHFASRTAYLEDILFGKSTDIEKSMFKCKILYEPPSTSLWIQEAYLVVLISSLDFFYNGTSSARNVLKRLRIVCLISRGETVAPESQSAPIALLQIKVKTT